MKNVYIKDIEYYLPERILTNEDLSKEFPEWSAEKINKKIGIKERHIAADKETAGDLAFKAAIKIFEKDVDKHDIDFLILCTQSPDYFLPTTACILQSKLGLKSSCGAFDINLGCSGFVYGLSFAKVLVQTGMASNVLLVTAETYSKYIHEKDKGNRSLFGDAAAATLVSSSGMFKIGDFSFGTDGTGMNNLILKTGASRNRKVIDDLIFNESGNPESSDYLFMNGSEIFNFTLKTVPELLEQVIEKNNILKDDISYYVLHQANKYMLDFIRKKLKIEEDKFCYCLEKTGNTVSSTIPIALKETCFGEKNSGKIFIAGFGVGYSWAGTIIEKA